MKSVIGRLAPILLALSAGVSACDPAPVAQLTNNFNQPIVLRSVLTQSAFSSKPVDTTIAPGGAVKFYGWDKMRIVAGRCELAYTVPELPIYVGVVLPFDLQPDSKLYVRALKGQDLRYHSFALDAQPAGWPLEPSTTCS